MPGRSNRLSAFAMVCSALAVNSCAPTRGPTSSGWLIRERPIPCGERRGAYCFLNLNVGVREIDAAPDRTVLALDDPYTDEARAFIVEPKICRRSFATEVALVAHRRDVQFMGGVYDKLEIRLNRRGCQIANYYKIIEGPMGRFAGAITLLTLARPCFKQACDGMVFSGVLPETLPKRERPR
jgi:hypothetical protein